MPCQLRTLVVEDDLDFLAHLLQSLARRAGWAPPSHAVDDVQALRLLGRDATPDVLILDVGSPGLRGRELLRRVRDDLRFRRTTVVVTGAQLSPGTDRQAFLPGEVWITKPFDVDDLVTAVALARARIASDERLETSPA